jgi:hypothetical protein
MGLFKTIAEPLISRGIPVIQLREKTKIAFQHNWPDIASVNPDKIAEWDKEMPNANAACVAFPKLGGFWFFEVDKPNFHNEIEKQTGQKFPVTFTVRSSPGRGHFYFRQTPASIAMGNAQGKDDEGHEAWSARVDHRYVVAPGSFHPTSGRQYELLNPAEIVPAPDWLVQWCVKEASLEKKKINASPDGPPIPRGSHDTELFRIACMLRNAGMNYNQIRDNLYEICENRCIDKGEDWRDMCEKKAASACKYEVGQASKAVYISSSPAATTSTSAVFVPPEPNLGREQGLIYPVFPEHVMQGTSLYEGFVKPVCERNSRIPYFMFLPAAALMLNYLGTKVVIEDRNRIPSIYMVLIGEKGRAIKSSSVEDGIEYLSVCNVMKHAAVANGMAAGKSLVWTAGSPEGLGMEMGRTNCKNAVLFYDELSQLISKANIDSSSLRSALLTMYESGKFSNTVKAKKEHYALEPNSYCASLIACTTNEAYEDQWASLTGKTTGLDDRFIFVIQPSEMSKLTPQLSVNTVEGSVLTSKRMEKAVNQKTYAIDDPVPLEMKVGELGNRTEIRAEKWAMYFAVDLGRDSIDEECVDRGLAVAKYEKDVKKYLGSPEADSKIAAAQIKYRRLLERKYKGRAKVREMERAMNSSRYGTDGWYRIYDGLKKAGIILEFGDGESGSPKEVITRIPLEE